MARFGLPWLGVAPDGMRFDDGADGGGSRLVD